MPDRIDALGERPERLRAFSGDLLSAEDDAGLQGIVERAAELAGAPISLVSLVLNRTQYFRAHCGLPRDLATARATDRDVSFCQFVVRDDRTLVVENAARDASLPQHLVHEYGVSAYAGIPLRVGDAVLGTLCVIDVKPRSFSRAQQDGLEKLAEQARLRLVDLAARQRTLEFVEAAVRPSLAELSNLLVPLRLDVDQIRHGLVELRPFASMGKAGVSVKPGTLGGAASVLVELEHTVANLDEATHRICAQVRALETGLISRDGEELRLAITTALNLSRHFTRLVGGAEVHGRVPHVGVTAGAAALLSATLSAVAIRSTARPHGLSVRPGHESSFVTLEVSAPGCRAQDFADVAAELQPICAPAQHVRADAHAVTVRLPTATAAFQQPAAEPASLPA